MDDENINTSEFHERLLLLIQALNMNASSFSKKMGVRASVVSGMITGRKSKPSFENLQKIYIAFPTINLKWLLVGIGDMFETNQEIAGITDRKCVTNKTQENDDALIQVKKEYESKISDKNTIIESQKEHIETLKMTINMLKSAN